MPPTLLRHGLLAASLMLSQHAGAQTVKLKYKPATGTTYAVQYDNELNMHMSVEQMPINMQMNATTYYTRSVGKEEAGRRAVTVRCDRAVFKTEAMGQTMAYDSEQPEAGDATFRDAAAVVNKSAMVSVSEDGKFRPLGLTKKTASDADASNERTDALPVAHQFPDIYPDKSVKVGDSWQKQGVSVVSDMKMNMKATYRLERLEGGIATISMNSLLNSDPSGSETDGDKQFLINGSQQGEISMEVATGVVLAMEMTQDLSGEIKMEGRSTPVSVSGREVIKTTKK